MIAISRGKKLGGIRLATPEVFRDFRGEYVETWNTTMMKFMEIKAKPFVQDDFILSKKYVLRGFHGDDRTWKLISCIYGEFFIAVTCIDPNNEDFLITETLTLNDRNRTLLLLPPYYVNAHLCISGECIFHYKQTTAWNQDRAQYSIKWNDGFLNVPWPIAAPILSERDKNAYSIFHYLHRDDEEYTLDPPDKVQE